MRTGLITTVNTNIGDDLIREGICSVLREVFRGHEIEFVLVNKHQPLSVFPEQHPMHLAKMTRYLPKGRYHADRLIARLASRLGPSRLDSCDLVVQCGAPVLWPGCHRCEWAEPIWNQVIGRLWKRIPVLNLAAGACYPWERQPARVDDPDDARYLRTILGYCCLTTVRDALAQSLCASLGTQTPLIPCSAFLATRQRVACGGTDGIVVINYMRGAGHYDWGQEIDPARWENMVKALLGRLKNRHRLAFLCHSEEEYLLAQGLDPTLPRLWPKTAQEYSTLVSEASVGLCNRVHGAVALAGLGVPCVAVGTDTRLLMVDAIGLPYWYVKKASVDELEHTIEDLLTHRSQARERLLGLRSKAWKQYVEAVADAIR